MVDPESALSLLQFVDIVVLHYMFPVDCVTELPKLMSDMAAVLAYNRRSFQCEEAPTTPSAAGRSPALAVTGSPAPSAAGRSENIGNSEEQVNNLSLCLLNTYLIGICCHITPKIPSLWG